MNKRKRPEQERAVQEENNGGEKERNGKGNEKEEIKVNGRKGQKGKEKGEI